jgi:hypothetical protein
MLNDADTVNTSHRPKLILSHSLRRSIKSCCIYPVPIQYTDQDVRLQRRQLGSDSTCGQMWLANQLLFAAKLKDFFYIFILLDAVVSRFVVVVQCWITIWSWYSTIHEVGAVCTPWIIVYWLCRLLWRCDVWMLLNEPLEPFRCDRFRRQKLFHGRQSLLFILDCAIQRQKSSPTNIIFAVNLGP